MATNEAAAVLKEGKDSKYSKMAGDFKEVSPEDYGLDMDKNTKYYPNLRLKLEDIPEAADWEIGKQYTVAIVVEMKSLSKGEKYSDVGFDVLAVKAGEETSGYKDDDDE